MEGTHQAGGSPSSFLRHEPCPKCGSKNNLARYSDGHAFCFGHGCGYFEKAEGEPADIPKLANDFIYGEYIPLTKRGIDEETCRKYSYQVGTYTQNGKRVPVHIANYYREGCVVGQKIRFENKNFMYLNDGSGNPPLYGQHLWNGGKMVVITEGEIDALSVAQVMGLKWPVVSVPTGAAGARKVIQRELEWLDKFERVVFMFDMDDPGQDAAKACAQLLTPGKARIAFLPLKDANEMLKAGRGSEIVRAAWDAKEYRPDGIVAGPDTWEFYLRKKNAVSFPYPWAGLNKLTYGLRKQEIVTVTAGTGIGKSTFCREMAHYLVKKNQRVGYIALEESAGKTVESFLSLELNIPLHLRPDAVSEDVVKGAWERVFKNERFFLYDHWGSTDIDNLISKMRYLVKACGVDWIFLDHISIVVSGIAEGDERRMIDNIMTKLRTFTENTNVGLILVSHLRKSDDKTAHEEGGRVKLSQLRGSGAIAQLSDIAIGIERDQQADEESDVGDVRVLKNRFSGMTGLACQIVYDRITGRYLEYKKDTVVAKPINESEVNNGSDY